jgi:hypothetical protein
MSARRKKTAAPPPSTATWLELDAAARAAVLEQLTRAAEVREQLAKEHPEDAAIYLRDAAPFRAAIQVLQAAVDEKKKNDARPQSDD